MLFLDLDRFKLINDSIGHMVGDQLLIGIAQRLRQCVRPVDKVAGLGGDEFTILLDSLRDESEAIEIAERIQHQVSQPFILNGYETFTTASIGISFSSSPSCSTACATRARRLRSPSAYSTRSRSLSSSTATRRSRPPASASRSRALHPARQPARRERGD